jgi:glycosyltransferase involved in cell wall biosynthesis
MVRVLFVAPWLPSRIRPRSLAILRALADVHDVWFVGLGGRHELESDLRDLPLVGLTIVQPSVLGSVFRACRAVVKGGSLQVAFVREPRLRSEIEHVMKRFDPDVVHMNVIRSMAYVDVIGGGPVVYDLDEVRSEYYRQLRASGAGPAATLIASIEGARMKKLEDRAVERSHRLLVSSPADAAIFGEKAVTIRSGHALGAAAQEERSLRAPYSRQVLFVGRMGYTPNVLGIRWFVRSVWPRILDRVPDATLWIVGESPPRSVAKLASSSVRVTGRVPSVDEYYRDSAVAVVPIRVGTGVQMKLIEALSAAVPTVMTEEAARRAGLSEGAGVVARTVWDWSSAIVGLLTEPSMAVELGAAGQAWVQSEYGQRVIRDRVLRVYRDIGDACGG